MLNLIQQDIDLWDVWIEYDQFHPEFFGTLYVHGEILSDKREQIHLTRSNVANSRQLILQLPEHTRGCHYTTEVMYSERVKNLNQYSSVLIYKGSEMIGCFTEIEIMI